MKAIASKSPIDLLVDDYRGHLINVAGLQASTCQKWTYLVRLFLNAQFKPKAPLLPLRQLEPGVLLDFVLQQAEHYRPGQLQSLASALRSFCRFLCGTGRHARDLSAALPSISGHHREDLPIYLSRAQLKQLLEVFDRRTLLGKRDYALALCLARLGLRAGEAARLSLDDLDWRNGRVRLTAPKSRRERHLPLPNEVGQALAACLQRARPNGATRTLFCRVRGQRPLRSGWLSERVGAAMARAGLGGPGKRAHLLRRTFATQLVQQGASLKAVADLLGHASLSTTQVYAKVNLPMLRAVAQPWPWEVRP
ncbi:MAG: tyrosine-type recombinase/integrase [Verrucomicrobia bacterium]|nr:tyrosine-type recombinase/integrase [Verrucomicrobiota bacterium]